jgi:hypothetical protein
MVTPLIAFRHQLWSLYLGSKFSVYMDVPLVMTLLFVNYWASAPATFIGWGVFATRRLREISMITIATSIFNVAMTLYFVVFLHLGAIGSALGTLSSVAVFNPVMLWLIGFKLLGMEFGAWFRDVLWRGLPPSLIAGLFAIAWRESIRPRTIPELLLAFAVVAIVYALSVPLFWTHEDARLLKQLFARLYCQFAFILSAPGS